MLECVDMMKEHAHEKVQLMTFGYLRRRSGNIDIENRLELYLLDAHAFVLAPAAVGIGAVEARPQIESGQEKETLQ